MSDLRSQVLNEVAHLETLQADLAGISKRTDEGRLRELIQLRRRLSEQIGRVGTTAERYFESIGEAGQLQEFRTHFSSMRSKAATHQASWPAVLLNEAAADYQQSARGVREANQAFVAWIRAKLGTSGAGSGA